MAATIIDNGHNPISGQKMCLRRRVGLVLTVVNLVNVVGAVFYFTVSHKLSLSDWLACNGCTPSIILFTLGFFLDNRILTGFSVPFLFFFGVLGLFTFPWDIANAAPQFSHIVMGLTIVWTVWDAVSCREIKKTLAGLAVGFVVLVPTLKFLFSYQARHPYLYEILRIPEEYRHR